MSLKRLTAIVVVCELIGLGVYFSFTIAYAYATGGVIRLDMTQFGEQHIEYTLVLVLLAVTPYALYATVEEV